MKITFIGTSHGAPEPHQKCSCIMLEIEKQIYFIDMGTNAIEALCKRGISANDVKAVFITHMHGDHTNGLIPFADLLGWRYKLAEPIVCLPDVSAAKVIEEWLLINLDPRKRNIHYKETRSGVVYDDGILKVTAIATRHCANSYAYLVEAEGKTLLFTGDLLRPQKDFPDIARERALDLVVCESAHFPATEYLPVFDECDIKQVCVTHYSIRYLESVLQLRQELISRELPMTIATDDCEINL